jgi:S1-C subfamily serine protease
MRVAPAFLLSLCVALPVSAAAGSGRCPTTEELGEQIIASTVTVLADGDEGIQGSGSGFFVEPDLVVTNWHVVEGSKQLRIKLTSADDTFPVAGIVAADLANDLAVLRIAPPVTGKALTLLDEVPKRGARIYAFGSPRLLEATMSDGIVSAEREIDGAPRIQITAAVSPGSSGGPVTDDCGRVIGVAYMKVRDAEALNFVIPTSFVVAILGKVGEPKSAEVWRQTGQDELKKVTATRLGVPDGIDPEQWVQVDQVAQRFLIGLDRRPLDGVAFFKHVGRGDLVTEADNTVPALLYTSGAICGGLSLCGCLVSVPLFFLGPGVITGPIAGLGLCGSAGLAGAGFVMWQDGVVPELSFKEREALARTHNDRLQKKSPTRDAADDEDEDDAGDLSRKPVGDPPPPVTTTPGTPTPAVERPAAVPRSMSF